LFVSCRAREKFPLPHIRHPLPAIPLFAVEAHPHLEDFFAATRPRKGVLFAVNPGERRFRGAAWFELEKIKVKIKIYFKRRAAPPLNTFYPDKAPAVIWSGQEERLTVARH
jgi:hypothetical protein